MFVEVDRPAREPTENYDSPSEEGASSTVQHGEGQTIEIENRLGDMFLEETDGAHRSENLDAEAKIQLLASRLSKLEKVYQIAMKKLSEKEKENEELAIRLCDLEEGDTRKEEKFRKLYQDRCNEIHQLKDKIKQYEGHPSEPEEDFPAPPGHPELTNVYWSNRKPKFISLVRLFLCVSNCSMIALFYAWHLEGINICYTKFLKTVRVKLEKYRNKWLDEWQLWRMWYHCSSLETIKSLNLAKPVGGIERVGPGKSFNECIKNVISKSNNETSLVVVWYANGSGHCIVGRKTACEKLELLDPQSLNRWPQRGTDICSIKEIICFEVNFEEAKKYVQKCGQCLCLLEGKAEWIDFCLNSEDGEFESEGQEKEDERNTSVASGEQEGGQLPPRFSTRPSLPEHP